MPSWLTLLEWDQEHLRPIKSKVITLFCQTSQDVPQSILNTHLGVSNIPFTSLIAQLVKNPPAIQETPLQFLGQENALGEGIGYPLQYSWTSLVAQLVKNLPAMWETWVWYLGWEDLLEKEQLPTPVFWPGQFHGLYSPLGHKESDMTKRLSLSLTQYSLQAPMKQ